MPEAQRRLAAIMFTDIVGYTTLTQESEALSMEILDEHNSLLRAIFPKYGGKEVKTIGDAFHVEFASALEAIRCAVEIQKALRERNAAVSAEKKIHIRIGVHVGDVMPQEQDIFGDAVNIAARVQPLALPGGICFTQDVFLQIRNKIDAPILRLGEGELKGIQVPVEIYRLILPWEKETLRFTERWAFRLQQKRIRYAIALTTLALLSIGGWWLYYTYIAPPIPAEARSIAVLPFIDLSQYHNYEYFSDGMTEELLNALAQLEELRVVARTSAFAFKGKNEDIRRIGQKLNVATVLEGSIRIQGEKMRVTAQLNRTSDGYHLWSQDYDGELKDAFAIQEKISRAIANELKIKLAGPVVKPSTGNQEAYELYLQGRYFMNKKTKEGFEKAIEYFNEALAKDPKYALAYAGLADTYGLLAAWGYGSVAEASAKAKEAAQKAVELDDTIAEVHVPLARMHWNN
ncbi:hypothetical protein HY009_04250, partial [Candidatus Acetothermia bacterium]|nr:hypothetical protein [Candidatus Acetothermia bacterium]